MFGQFMCGTDLKQFSLIKFFTSFQIYLDCSVWVSVKRGVGVGVGVGVHCSFVSFSVLCFG